MSKKFIINLLMLFIPLAVYSFTFRYSVFEISDINNNTFNNPFDFDEIEYKVIFTAPSGCEYHVTGFFDGIKEKNQIWKARLAPMEIGQWKFSAAFSDGSKAGSGQFNVTPSVLHGPVVRDPDHPYKFMHHDGTPIFILGNTIYNILGATESEWETVLSNQLKLCAEVGFNKVRFAPYSEHEYKNNPVGWNAHPWHVRPDGTIDYTRYNLSHWRKIEEMVQRFGLQSVIADFIFVMHELCVDDGLGEPFSKQRIQYYKYAVARLHGYWNIAWDLENEANEIHNKGSRFGWENYDHIWYNRFGELIVSHDPYLQYEPEGFGRMLGVHDNTTPPDFKWMNHTKIQWKTTVPQGQLFQIDPLINEYYRGYKYEKNIIRSGKPVIQEEYGYEGEQMLEYIDPDSNKISQELSRDNLLDQSKNMPGKPHSLGDKGDRQRRTVWTIVTCGAFASYGDKSNLFNDEGQQIDPGRFGRPYISGDIRGSTAVGLPYLSVLTSFVKEKVTVETFQNMYPHHEYIKTCEIKDFFVPHKYKNERIDYPNYPPPPYNMAFCLADPGNAYLVYLPYGGWIEMDIKPIQSANLRVIWLDPKTGHLYDGRKVTVETGKNIRISPPRSKDQNNIPDDWVLYLVKK